MKAVFLVVFVVIMGVSTTKAQQKTHLHFSSFSENFTYQNDSIELKNPNTAMWMSVGSTIGTYVLFAALASTENPSPFFLTVLSLSHLASPALGYLYTDNWNDFWDSVARRFVGRLVIGAGAIIVIISSLESLFESGDQNTGAIIAGLGLMLGGAIYNISITFKDFRQVRTRVDEYNEGLVQSVQLMPSFDPVNKAIGVGFRVNF